MSESFSIVGLNPFIAFEVVCCVDAVVGFAALQGSKPVKGVSQLGRLFGSQPDDSENVFCPGEIFVAQLVVDVCR